MTRNSVKEKPYVCDLKWAKTKPAHDMRRLLKWEKLEEMRETVTDVRAEKRNVELEQAPNPAC